MHIIRSTMGDYILDETGLLLGTASLMIGHETAGDRRNELDRAGQTGNATLSGEDKRAFRKKPTSSAGKSRIARFRPVRRRRGLSRSELLP
jgi:hypothetical protein